MAQHAQFRTEKDLDIYFYDPQTPWQQGSKREHQ